MEQGAKAFWINAEEPAEVEAPAEFEDIACLSTGVPDDSWKCGSD